MRAHTLPTRYGPTNRPAESAMLLAACRRAESEAARLERLRFEQEEQEEQAGRQSKQQEQQRKALLQHLDIKTQVGMCYGCAGKARRQSVA